MSESMPNQSSQSLLELVRERRPRNRTDLDLAIHAQIARVRRALYRGPIRDAVNREALWRGLEAGAIDCVVSDHSPCPPEMKRRDSGDFGAAWGGIASLQVGLAAVWTAGRRRGRTLADVARWMSAGPAALAGLPAKGAIEVGRDADLVAFDPEATFTVRGTELRHRSPVTPYEGRTLAGRVRQAWLRGQAIGPEARAGRLLRRGPAGPGGGDD